MEVTWSKSPNETEKIALQCAPIRPANAVADTLVTTEKSPWLEGLVKKAKHPKVRSGCLTCKQRRLKCDEAKPACLRCCKSGKECAGYGRTRTSNALIPFQPQTGGANHDAITVHDDKLLEHFLTEATDQLAGFSLSLKQFCCSLAPQLSYHYPAVRFALLAVAAKTQAATFRWDRRRRRSEALESKASALLYYNQAIQCLTASRTADLSPAVYLVCGLLFGANELWPHVDMAPTVHILTAFKLVLRCASSLSEEVQRGMFPFLVHMGRKTLAIDDNLPPDLESAMRYFSWLQVRPDPIPNVFACTEQAWATMDVLQNFISALSPNDPAFHDEARPQAEEYAADVRLALMVSMQVTHEDNKPQYRALLMHHRTLQVMLEAKRGTDEGVYDMFTADFEHILYECESLLEDESRPRTPSKGPWQCTLGLLPPLFFVATRCRIASLRHRAIKALHSSKRREREWNSCVASMLARLVVQIEEKQRLHDLGGGGGGIIPVHARIRLESVIFHRTLEQMSVRYSNPTTHDSGTKVLSWKAKDAIDDEFECVRLSSKQLEASGYSGILLIAPPIQCQCGGPDDACR